MLRFNTITALQKTYGAESTQKLINSGMCWKLEGAQGRHAMRLLEMGVCMLPKTVKYDYYGSPVPSRYMVKKGSKGSFANAQSFWQKVVDGDIDMDEFIED
jgi:hypothetical protein